MTISKRPLSPTGVAKASRCLHTWYLECHGDPSGKRAPDAGTLLMFERGLEYERGLVQGLQDVAQPAWDGQDWGKGQEATVALMKKGQPWIYQGVLCAASAAGRPDLLRCVDGNSQVGGHSYIPVDIKGHKEVVKKDRYQLLMYAMLLEPILGSRPERGGIWLNTGEIAEVDLTKDAAQFSTLINELERISRGELTTQGYRCSECNGCAWLDLCAAHWDRTDSVCLIYGVTGGLARRFEKASFASWRQVAESTPVEISRLLQLEPGKARDIHLHARARASGVPQLRSTVRFPDGIPVHFYDIETYGKTTYLHGNIRVLGGDREEKQFLARHTSEEREAWHAYLDYLARDPKAVVYCWADYERGFVHSLWEKYGGNEAGWKHLRHNLVDQCQFVREHFALPVASYSIKRVAPVFGFHWSAEDAGGLNSETWYKDWLETKNEAILAKLLRYNLDDVVAMEVIDRALRQVTVDM